MDDKFNPDWKLRIAREVAETILRDGRIIGDGTRTKDCFWRAYEYKGEFFLGLNDFPDLWKVTETVAYDYAEQSIPTTRELAANQ